MHCHGFFFFRCWGWMSFWVGIFFIKKWTVPFLDLKIPAKALQESRDICGKSSIRKHSILNPLIKSIKIFGENHNEIHFTAMGNLRPAGRMRPNFIEKSIKSVVKVYTLALDLTV
jgi:hypothetical protein